MKFTTMTHELPVERRWFLVDASCGIPLGRLASRIAFYLQGKHKPCYTPFGDVGDVLIVINADKVFLTGKKANQKIYRHHSGFVGGLKEIAFSELLQKDPRKIVASSVKGMLPRNKVRDRMMGRLKIYAEPSHPHQAQNPILLSL